jgi:NADH-quinone oxidoreductase subunit G
VPVEQLYDHATTMRPSQVLEPRLAEAAVMLNPTDAENLGIAAGDMVEIRLNGRVDKMPVLIETETPSGKALVGRSQGLAIVDPLHVEVKPAS